MLGAIIGDIIGSRFEFKEHKNKEFDLFHKYCKFTDDSVMTVAVALALIACKDINDEHELKNLAVEYMVKLGQKYPNRGYGTMFKQYLASDILNSLSFFNIKNLKILYFTFHNVFFRG